MGANSIFIAIALQTTDLTQCLQLGDRVSFSPEEGERGPQASSVKPLGGTRSEVNRRRPVKYSTSGFV